MKATKWLVAGALAAAVAVAAVAQAEDKAAAKDAPKDMTMSGEILDMVCYMSSEAHGEKHKACAQSCLKRGNPMGLLTSDGKVILLVEDHGAAKAFEDLKAKGGDIVQVTGPMFERGGLAAMQVKSSAAPK